jgi:hypothetical protein
MHWFEAYLGCKVQVSFVAKPPCPTSLTTMRGYYMKRIFAGSLLLTAMTAASAFGQGTAPLKLVKTVTLPGYTGDFDHFAVDRQRGRFLLAAEDHATLEIFDLKTGDHLKTIKGFGAPHTILIRPTSSNILVTDSDQMTSVLNAETYGRTGR